MDMQQLVQDKLLTIGVQSMYTWGRFELHQPAQMFVLSL